MHVPVMLARVPGVSGVRPDGVYLDATAGLGGHTGAIARQLTTGLVLACDRDAESLDAGAGEYRGLRGRASVFIKASFSQVGEALAAEGITQVDGLLADLGVSRYQLTEGERGFSLMADGPLDMRMDRSAGADRRRHRQLRIGKGTRRLDLSVGRGKEEPEDSQSNRAGAADSNHRSVGQADREAVPRTGKLHPATQTFMALRIAVNEEKEELDALLAVDSAAGEAGRASGDAHLHVARGPQSEAKFSGAWRETGERRFSPATSCGLRKKKSGTIRRRASAKLRAVEIIVTQYSSIQPRTLPPPVSGAEG